MTGCCETACWRSPESTGPAYWGHIKAVRLRALGLACLVGKPLKGLRQDHCMTHAVILSIPPAKPNRRSGQGMAETYPRQLRTSMERCIVIFWGHGESAQLVVFAVEAVRSTPSWTWWHIIYYPSAAGKGVIPGACWPASLAESVGSRFTESPCLRQALTSGLHCCLSVSIAAVNTTRGKDLFPLTVYSPSMKRSPGSSLGTRTKAEDLEEICRLPCSIVGRSACFLISSRTICPGWHHPHQSLVNKLHCRPL